MKITSKKYLNRKVKELVKGSQEKKLKGNELVGWLGEIYCTILFPEAKLLSDDTKEYDVCCGDMRISVKTRKGVNKGWQRTSLIRMGNKENENPTHLLFVHLKDDYQLKNIWLFEWDYVKKRLHKCKVRGQSIGYYFLLNPLDDFKFCIFSRHLK